MLQPFNLNHVVYVRLNEYGHHVLRQNHERLFGEHAATTPQLRREPDAQGRTRFLLWELMSEFGHVLHNGSPVPFDMTIELEIEAAPEGSHFARAMGAMFPDLAPLIEAGERDMAEFERQAQADSERRREEMRQRHEARVAESRKRLGR